MSSHLKQASSSSIIFDYQQEKKEQVPKKHNASLNNTQPTNSNIINVGTNQNNKVIEAEPVIIKVKSTPRIRNRNKIHAVNSEESQRSKKNMKVKKLVFEELDNDDDEPKNQKEQKQSMRDTKPTKSVEEYEGEDNQYNNNQQYHNNQYYEPKEKQYPQVDTFEYKLYPRQKPIFKEQKSATQNVIPCKAKRQLGNSDSEKEGEQIQQKQQQYESSQQQEKPVKKPPQKPSLNLKFSSTQLPSFFSTPLPHSYQFESILDLDESFFSLGNRYNLKQKYENKYIISAKKQLLTFGTNILLSMDPKNHSRRNKDFIGLLTGNFGGTNWELMCPILSMRFGEGEVCQNMRSTMVVKYRSSVLGSQSCREMRVLIINPQTPKKILRTLQPQFSLQNIESLSKNPNILHLYTVKPVLQKGRYIIDFHGLAKQPSSKNFILQTKQGVECLIFAKQSQSVYALNIRYPLNIMQGFALALASLNSKLLVN